jgi:hypothetical protein
MAENVNDITITYEEDGVVIVKELDKAILSKGAWATLMFRYQQWDKRKQEYGPERYTIRRYRKMQGEYRAQGKFNISSADQAGKIVEVLKGWIK